MGFTRPTTTQSPDPIFDYWLTRLTGAELRVLLYAVRRTYGFKKDDDNISLDQFEHGIRSEDGAVLDEGCGCSRKSILRAIKLLVDKGLLIKTRRRDADRRDEVNNYRLHIVDERQERAAYGFRKVNTTQVPDDVFDHWLPRLSDAELCVLLYIIRRTLGFQKPADVISPEQFLTGVRTRAGTVLDGGCGVSKKHLYLALAGLKEKGLVAVQRRRSRRAGNIPSIYSLIFENDVPDILSQSPDDLDPRAAVCEARDDVTFTAAVPVARRAADDGVEAIAARPGGGPQQGVSEAPRGEQCDDKRGANGRIGGSAATTRGKQKVAKGGAYGPRQGGAPTPGGGRSDDQGCGSQRAPQQTARNQQTGGQETVGRQTDIQDDSMSKASRHRTPLADSEGSPEPATLARYSALISQRIADLSLLFHDQDRQRSNRTRALRLWAKSGLSEQTFADMVQEARLVAMKRGNIEKDAADGTASPRGAKNRMPYFFAVLEDLVDMAHDTGSATQPARQEGGRRHASGSGVGRAMEMPTAPDAPLPGHDVSRASTAASRRRGGMPPSREATPHRLGRDGVESADSALWADMLDEVRCVLTPENYTTWLGATYVIGRVGQVLRVAVPTKFHQEWLAHKLQGRIMATLERLGHGGVQVEYVVVPVAGAEERG